MNTDEREEPERIYIHPSSAEYHLSRWPLEEGEYIEYVRADIAATTSSPAAQPDKVPNYALIQLLNAAMLHPESAEEYIRRVIEELSAGPSPAAASEELAELDRVLVQARLEDPVGVHLTELQLERMDRQASEGEQE